MKVNFKPNDLTIFLTGMIDQSADRYRQTGRTTELAKAYINWGLTNLDLRIRIKDHFHTLQTDQYLGRIIQEIWDGLEESRTHTLVIAKDLHKSNAPAGALYLKVSLNQEVLKGDYLNLMTKLKGE